METSTLKRTFLDDQQLCRTWIKALDVILKDLDLLSKRLAEGLRDIDDPVFQHGAQGFNLRIVIHIEAICGLRKQIGQQLDFLDMLPQPLPESPYQYAELETRLNQLIAEFELIKRAIFQFLKGW